MDCIDLFKRAAMALQTDSRYLALDQARKMNDSDEELRTIAEFLYSVKPTLPWHISAFHPDYKMKEKTRTPEATLKRAYAIGKNAGLKNIYMGNVHSHGAEDTFCCECGERLVKRDWYDVTVVGKEVFDGKCLKCGAKQDGVWETEMWIVCLKRVRDLRNDRMNK